MVVPNIHLQNNFFTHTHSRDSTDDDGDDGRDNGGDDVAAQDRREGDRGTRLSTPPGAPQHHSPTATRLETRALCPYVVCHN